MMLRGHLDHTWYRSYLNQPSIILICEHRRMKYHYPLLYNIIAISKLLVILYTPPHDTRADREVYGSVVGRFQKKKKKKNEKMSARRPPPGGGL